MPSQDTILLRKPVNAVLHAITQPRPPKTRTEYRIPLPTSLLLQPNIVGTITVFHRKYDGPSPYKIFLESALQSDFLVIATTDRIFGPDEYCINVSTFKIMMHASIGKHVKLPFVFSSDRSSDTSQILHLIFLWKSSDAI